MLAWSAPVTATNFMNEKFSHLQLLLNNYYLLTVSVDIEEPKINKNRGT